MTREDFFENINDWGDLKDFAEENNCYILDDVYDEDSMNDYISEELIECARSWSWMEVRDWLDGLPTDSYWYRRDDYGDWISLGDYDDLDRAKEEVAEWIDENGEWDEEEEEAPYEDPDDERKTEEEGFSIVELMAASSAVMEVARMAGASEEMCAEIEANYGQSITELLNEKGA